MKNYRKYLPYIFVFILVISAIGIWYLVYLRSHHTNLLKVAFLDVGQGDAIYIEAPNGRQVLIDGGPDAKVLSQLSKVMPWGDRSIDMVITTHADADHIGGLPFVLDQFKIGRIMENGTTSDTKIYQSLENRIAKQNIPKIIARRGQHIIIDPNKIFILIFYFQTATFQILIPMMVR